MNSVTKGKNTPEQLAEKWGEIRSIIQDIPTREELESLYREIGAKTTLWFSWRMEGERRSPNSSFASRGVRGG